MKRLLVPLAISALLGGCAVYEPPPAYASYPVYPYPQAPVAPAPAYVPPVSFSFGFFGDGHRGWHH
jgi:hypothetical protein